MSLVVEEPSRIVRMRIGDPLHNKHPSTTKTSRTGVGMGISNGGQEDSCLDKTGPGFKKVSIDFFDLNESDTVERPKKNKTQGTGGRGSVDGQVVCRDVDKLVFEEDFIRTVLENDIRVKNARYVDGLVFVYFSTLNDSISFYRQFSPYTEICFSHRYDFEQISLTSSCELGKLMLVDYAPDDDFLDECTAKNVYSPLHIMDGRPLPSETCRGTTDTNIHIPSLALGIVPDCRRQSQQMVFEKKVEYFLSLRNFFSKNDMKTMAQSLQTGDTSFLFVNTKELAVGSHSNKIMQEAIKLLSDVEIARVIENLGYDIAPIAANKYGAYTVQMLISVSNTALTQNLLSRYFREFGRFLVTHEIGNYAVQKVLRFDPGLVYDFFLSNAAEVARCELGMKVLRRCLEFFPDRTALLEKIQEHTGE